MKKQLLSLGMFALTMSTSVFAQGSYSISGETGNADFNGDIVMTDIFTRSAIDTATVSAGKFTFTGEIAKPTMAMVASRDGDFAGMFVLEPGTFSLENHAEAAASGSPLNDAYKAYIDSRLEIMNSSDSSDVKNEKLLDGVKSLLANHKNDALGAYAIMNLMYYWDVNEILATLETCGDEVKNNPFIQGQLKTWEVQAKTSAGKMFVDFSAEYNGKKTSLSDYVGKGKYVLVDFWASWCGPCRQEIPNIAELYKKYKGDKFEILGVATWDKPDATEKAIAELGITWPQMINAQRAGSDAYGISGIPQIILFAPDGTIVARDLRGDKLKAAVDKAMAQ